MKSLTQGGDRILLIYFGGGGMVWSTREIRSRAVPAHHVDKFLFATPGTFYQESCRDGDDAVPVQRRRGIWHQVRSYRTGILSFCSIVLSASKQTHAFHQSAFHFIAFGLSVNATVRNVLNLICYSVFRKSQPMKMVLITTCSAISAFLSRNFAVKRLYNDHLQFCQRIR